MLNRVLVLLVSVVFATALLGVGPSACGKEPNIHSTQQGLSSDCIVCHQSAYVAAVNPKHADFPDTCQDCHNTELWSPLDKGVGDTIHEIEVVKTKLECASCHKDEYDKTTKPKHDPIFPIDCKDCHSTEQYAPLPRDIHGTQRFVKDPTCFPCHEEDYKRAVPDHSSFAKTCEACHNTGTAWKPIKTP